MHVRLCVCVCIAVFFFFCFLWHFGKFGSFCYCIINFNSLFAFAFAQRCLHQSRAAAATATMLLFFKVTHTSKRYNVPNTHRPSSVEFNCCVLPFVRSLLRALLDCCALANKTCREQDTHIHTHSNHSNLLSHILHGCVCVCVYGFLFVGLTVYGRILLCIECVRMRVGFQGQGNSIFFLSSLSLRRP